MSEESKKSEKKEMEIVKMDVIEQPLLERKKIIANVRYTGGTPTRAELKQFFANKLNTPVERILMIKMKQEYGLQEVKCLVHAYDSVDAKERFAQKHILRRNGDLPKLPWLSKG